MRALKNAVSTSILLLAIAQSAGASHSLGTGQDIPPFPVGPGATPRTSPTPGRCS